MNYIFYALLWINAITVIVFVLDKYLAISNRYRIREKHLLFWALIGGSVGAIAAQQMFRHKTQKFKYVLWLILAVHIVLGWFVWTNLPFDLSPERIIA